jgi:hypothetical protein
MAAVGRTSKKPINERSESMKKNLLLSFLVGLSLVLTCPSAEAQSPVIDQMQPVVDLTVGVVYAIGGQSEQKLAQTVTADMGGRLRGVFLPLTCGSGQLVIEIRTLDGDTPSDVVLTRRTFPAWSIPYIGPGIFRFFWLGLWPLAFAPGDRFAVVLLNPTGSCVIFQGPLGDSYTGGEGFFEALPNPPGWVPFSETETHLDLPFITVIRP